MGCQHFSQHLPALPSKGASSALTQYTAHTHTHTSTHTPLRLDKSQRQASCYIAIIGQCPNLMVLLRAGMPRFVQVDGKRALVRCLKTINNSRYPSHSFRIVLPYMWYTYMYMYAHEHGTFEGHVHSK